MRAFILVSPFYILGLHGIGDLGADVAAMTPKSFVQVCHGESGPH